MSQNDNRVSTDQWHLNAPKQEVVTSDNTATSNEQKLVEAKTAVVLLKNSRLCTKNEYTQWMLKNLFQPFTKKDCEVMNILYLSRSRRRIWKPEYFANQKQSESMPNAGNMQPASTPSSFYVITPRTSVMTMNQEYRFVYVIDLSSSLATVGNTKADILLSDVFQTLRNSLEGIVQPFSLQVSADVKVVLRPLLRLTVLADCSQFASNINVIPVLISHPTMHVLMQNVVITAKNIDQVIKKLHCEFLSFQKDTSNFRKLLKQKRLTTEYGLDVGGEVLDATSMPPETADPEPTIRGKSRRSDYTNRPGNSVRTPVKVTSAFAEASQKKDDTSYHSSKKEVWGIGKSGANLSRILHASYFALKLLPPQGRAEVVLITDGAMKSNVHDNTFVRQFAEEDITCHIVQIGYRRSFVAGRNFGFVPDTEILRFLSRATGGSFMYSEQCKATSDTLLRVPNSELSQEPDGVPEQVTSIPSTDTSIPPPNLYHRNLLFRESFLSKHPSEARLQTDEEEKTNGSRDIPGGTGVEVGREPRATYNFPWDPDAKAPEEELRLLKYREYPLPAEFSHIIAARAREGFALQSITFDDSTGTRKPDPGIHNLEAPDFGAVRKERIQFTMLLHWQPNVTIEYRIRATWLPTIIGTSSQLKNETLLLSSGIFARAKAPRAEIYVRTDAGFAHILQNWDALRRRAQMMGVVTGSIYFGEAYAVPTYAKVEKLKSYLVDIFEGDEMLKTVIGFNSRFIQSCSAADLSSVPSLPSNTESDQKTTFMDAFRVLWERINTAEFRARTRCWYDYECLDILIGDVSPYMSPKLTSMYNQDFVSNVETEILTTVERVKEVLGAWADIEGEDGTFVRFVHRFTISPSTGDEGCKDYFSYSLGFPASFCELRIRREYGRLITLRLLLFNVDTQARKRTVEHLIHLLNSSAATNADCNKICRRPFSSLLMRDPKHFQDMSPSSMNSTTNRESDTAKASRISMARPKSWYLPASMWLTSEYIVRDYLKHMTWSWQTDNHQDQYHKSNKMMPIHDLAFQFLCQARLDQGYQLVSPRPDSTHFYQEISLPNRDGGTSLCAIQYFIWKDADSGRITTELWMEPSGNIEFDEYDLVKTWTVEPDRKTISQLVTFDQIHAVGRSKGKGYFKKKHSVHESTTVEDNTVVMMLPHLFDVASVLRANKFAVASFSCPQFSAGPDSGKTSKHRVLTKNLQNTPSIHFTPSPDDLTFARPEDDDKMYCLHPDSLLNRNKELIASLKVKEQNCVLLHYFMEHALSHAADGEIIMSHHDVGVSFWQKLKEAMQFMQGDSISSTRLVSNLREMQCYVKVFDVRSIVVVLFPSLETIASGLSTLQESDTNNHCSHFIDFFMFECMRQKPMKPTKSTLLFSSPLEEANRSRVANFLSDDEVVIKQIDHLVHKSDGLGEIWRPHLFQGQFRACPPHAQLSERVLRVAQDITRTYSRSFVKSFYAHLVRGFSVDNNDLSKVLEVCNESAMDIDITDFVNIMTLQKRDGKECESQEMEAQDMFLRIFQYYFEPVQTVQGARPDLFYYKPPFCRMASVESAQPLAPSEEDVTRLVDLVSYSHIPLLIRLECSYEATQNGSKNTVTVPVSFLPSSYTGKLGDGSEFNLEPSSIGSESSPLDSGSTSVTLHLVCLNVPYSEIDNSRQSAPSANDSLITSMNSQPSCFWELNQDQQQVLAATETRIRWLLAAETIHGLLRSETINKPLLAYIECKLQGKVPHVDFTTSVVVPFHFVKNPSQSRINFMDELEKDSETRDYRLQRVENYFYVSKERLYNLRGEAALSTATSPILDISVGDLSPCDSDDENANNEYCDGLGISLEYSTNTKEHEGNGYIPLQERPVYWLILVVQEHCVQIFFFSKLHRVIDSAEILRRITDKLSVIEKRTNQLMLLRSLQESQICSKYLESPSEDDKEDDNNSESDDEEHTFSELDGLSLRASNFTPGQFQCPVVFRRRFPLHWRIQPNASLRYLTADVLRLFIIHNRRHMFVVERDNSIVYCKIYEKNTSNTPDTETITSTVSPLELVPSEYATGDENAHKDNAISPIPLHKSPSIPTVSESRELVLEVHGIELPVWVEREFVDLIENRLMSHMTLNEIQQFFLRNPASKPTKADVDFILPFCKTPSCREVLRIPVLVHSLPSLMLLFKQSLITDNIKPFYGPHVVDAVQTYYNNVFHRNDYAVMQHTIETLGRKPEHTKEISVGEYCFYYNCIKRVPGTSTTLELAAGQGLAGICVTPLDSTGTPVVMVKESNAIDTDSDLDTIKRCLEDDFRETSTTEAEHSICIDIWTMGIVDADALLQHIYDCFRQSLCDYLIEKTVAINQTAILAAEIALHRNLPGRSDRQRDTLLRNNFIKSILYILQKSSEWKSSTVCTIDQAVHTSPWCMDDIINYVDNELRNIDVSLRPAVACTSLDNSILTCDKHQVESKWQRYRGSNYRQRQMVQNNTQFVVISGLTDVVENVGHYYGKERRSSAASDKSSHRPRSRRSSGGSAVTEASTARRSLRPVDEKSVRERTTASSTPRSMSANFIRTRQLTKIAPLKYSFFIMTLNIQRIVVYTYNWSEVTSLELFEGIRYIASRQETRNEILGNILHQKMGLFHHTEHIGHILDNCGTVSGSTPSTQNMGIATASTTPHIRLSSPNQAKKVKSMELPRKGDESSSARLSSRSASSGIATSSNVLSFRDMIAYSTGSLSRSSVEKSEIGMHIRPIESDNDENRMLLSIACNTELDRALMDSIADPISTDISSKNYDLLQQHGQPFLETYLRRTKLQSVHEKALKVYIKWRRKYGDPQSEIEQSAKLTPAEVATILRSSRVLHFCRTPLLFCSPDEEWPNMDEGSSNRDMTINWHSDLAYKLMSEYAKYLESLDMQLIDFANTANANDESLRLSTFTVAKNITIDCPAMYLLRVFEGGSIICEIRMTNVFVSVTLYTLHRQYGRLGYNRFNHESRALKRQKFKMFEETSGNFKQLIHINSFVYDFQLRYIQKTLDQRDKLPLHFNLPNVIRRFALLNRTPASYARNRILHGFYEFESTILPQPFFASLFRNAPRHGLANLVTDNVSVGTFVSSNDLSFLPQEELPSDWRHTLVICPTDENIGQDASKVVLEYFILVVYQGPNTTETMVKNSWTGVIQNAATSQSDNPLADLLLPSHSDTLGDIIGSARSRIDAIVSEVIARCNRVNDWSRIYAVETIPKEEFSALISLISEFDRVDLAEVDSNMAKFFKMELNWHAVLDTVIAMKRGDTKEISEDDRRHLFIYSARYMDFMIHLQVDQAKICGWLVSRETKEVQCYGVEREQIASLGAIICYFIWKETVGNQGCMSISS